MARLTVGILLATLLVAGSASADRSIDPTDDGQIAFVRTIRGKVGCAILVVRANGTVQRRLTRWNVNCGTPVAWSPDGARLAYYARGALWVMDGDGKNRRRLSPASYDESGGAGPSFSPDGQSIAFTRNPSSKVAASAIYTVRLGNSPRRLTHERFAWAPSWSPHGDLIAYISERARHFEIRVMRTNGTRQRRLVGSKGPAEDWFAWAPDGRSFAYMLETSIFTIRPSGAARRLLTSSADYLSNMEWAPDGHAIAFAGYDDPSDIYLMDKKGHHERAITRRFFNLGPSWSPDGARIAFAFFTRLEGPSRSGIAVINADGSHRREVTTGADSYPSWQPVP